MTEHDRPPSDPPSDSHPLSDDNSETLQPSHPAHWPFEDSGSPPKHIGPYRIIGVIGTGGMGAVYEAAQENPKRRVALKVLKTTTVSESMRRRFDFEVQALARLRHPGIAQIYDAGTYDLDGKELPYFAMEYIAGARTLTEYAKTADLDAVARVKLFSQICEAVHHGHQKGVIHRDLKPDNILVDRAGNPKIIDFGVARATNVDVAITTMQTSVGQIIGTLQYMSPEQCGGQPDDVDLRSDIYSLGVILYELLCGDLPYDVQQQAVVEAIRVIREDAPKRPSTVTRVVRGDLETITLKALEKRPERRYDSAAALGRDLHRYLLHEPIEAHPPSLIYQLSMIARRYRGPMAAAAIVIVAVVGGLVATSIAWSRANELNQQLEASNAEVVQQRDLAQSRLDDARTMHRNQLRRTYVGLRSVEGATAQKSELAGEVVAFFEQLKSDGLATREDLEVLADAHFNLGESLGGVIVGNVGEDGAAIRHLQKSAELWSEIAQSSPQESLPAMRVALMSRRAGTVYFNQQKWLDAIDMFEQCRDQLDQVPDDGQNRKTLARMNALTLMDIGDARDAIDDSAMAAAAWKGGLDSIRGLIAAGQNGYWIQSDLGQGLRRVGLAMSEKDLSESRQLLRESRDVFGRLQVDYPDRSDCRRNFGWAHYYVGWAAAMEPDRDEAVDSLNSGWTIIVLRCKNSPNDAQARGDVEKFMNSMMELHQTVNAAELTPVRARAAAIVLQPVVESNPRNIALSQLFKRIIDQGGAAESGTAAQVSGP